MSAEQPSPDILHTAEAGSRVIRGGVLRGAGYGVGTAFAVVTSVLLLRALGVDDFGRYATVAALVGIVATVTDAGLTAIGSRELALRSAGPARAELLGLLVGLRIVFTTIGVLLAVLFAWAVGYDSVQVWGTLLAGVGVLLVNTQATAMMPLSVELRFGAVTAIEVLRQALTLAGVVVLAVAGAALLPYFAVQVAVGVGVLALTPSLVGGARALRPRFERGAAAQLLRDALPVAIALTMNVLYLRVLVVVVSLTEDETETGLYGTSFRVFELLVGIPTLVLSVALPVLAVAGVHDLDRLRYSLQRMTEVSLVVSLALALATTAFAEPAIRLLFGEDYVGAAPILEVQAWALVPLFLGQVAVLALLALRHQRAIAIANTVALVVVLVLGLLLVEIAAGRGAALAGVVAETVLLVILAALLARAERGVFPGLRFAWRPLTALVAGLVPLVVLGLGTWAGAILATACFVVVAALVRALPYEVVEALRRRDPGSRADP